MGKKGGWWRRNENIMEGVELAQSILYICITLPQ
jgi:hypothetical protein